jgi:hypothetical protein
MKLNFYFEYPQGVPDPDAEFVSYDNCDISSYIVPCELYRNLKKLHPNIEIVPINTWAYMHELINGPSGKYSSAFVIIENDATKKYIVLSYCDNLTRVSSHNGWDFENCVDFFAFEGVQANDSTYEYSGFKYTPCTFTTYFKSAHNTIERLYQNHKQIPNKLFFRGGKYLFREYLSNNDDRFQINHDRIPANKFIEELSKYSINIDLNSVAEISCRTLDSIGLKSALIRPKLTIQYHNPLIPDYHYAAVKCDDLSDYKVLADAYIERFEDLKKDPELVKFLSENGRKWYEENATIEANIKILIQLINLNKLC